MKQRPLPDFQIPSGSNVFIHQAFRCCPYAGLITSKIHDFVEANGYSVVDEPSEAAVQVINTCGYNETRSQLALDAIATVRQESPDSAVVVAGCLTRILPQAVDDALVGVARQAVIGPRRLDDLDLIFAHDATSFEATPTHLHKDRYSHVDPRDGLFQVQVSTGCLGKCTFCAIRRSMGRPRSMSIEAILADIQRGLDAGYRDFMLSSTDASSYGADIGLTFVDLLRAVSEVDADCLFTVESFDPTLFIPRLDELLPIFATRKFACIYLPIQAGSQRIVDLMGRRYRVADVVDAIDRLHEADPDLLVVTDIIYGFADETWAEFMESVEVGRRYDYAKYNNYEPRPSTPPLQLGREEMVARRAFVMEELQRQGPEVEVLTRRRIIPYDGPLSVEEDITARLPAPIRDFLTEWEARFSRLIEKKHGVPLGPEWTIGRVEVDPRKQAVILTAGGPGDATLTLALAHPATQMACFASSDRFLLTHLERQDEGEPGHRESKQRALALLAKMLGLTPVRQAPPPPRFPILGQDDRPRIASFAAGMDRWSEG